MAKGTEAVPDPDRLGNLIQDRRPPPLCETTEDRFQGLSLLRTQEN